LIERILFDGGQENFPNECVMFVYGDVSIRKCEFRNIRSNGAPLSLGPGTSIVEECIFRDNVGNDDYGGGAVQEWGDTEIRRCTFIGNQAANGGGAIANQGRAIIEDCVFLRNKANTGAAIMGRDPSIRRCTFLLNECMRPSCSCLETIGTGDWENAIQQCIVAKTINGFGIECSGVKIFECCDFWMNERGDYVGFWCSHGDDEGCFSADPLFCNETEGDLHLLEGSPCLPQQHGLLQCGLVGALGVGCAGSPTQKVTWGRIKSSFRDATR